MFDSLPSFGKQLWNDFPPCCHFWPGKILIFPIYKAPSTFYGCFLQVGRFLFANFADILAGRGFFIQHIMSSFHLNTHICLSGKIIFLLFLSTTLTTYRKYHLWLRVTGSECDIKFSWLPREENDQIMSQRSQVPGIALWRYSPNVFAFVFLSVRSCFFITHMGVLW